MILLGVLFIMICLLLGRAPFIAPFAVQIVADLVDLGVLLVAVVVSAVLQRRDVSVVADEAVQAAAAVVLLGYGLRNRCR